ncbi:MAG: hypothetical protein ABI203_07810 [Mucilaginibacter sp.]
MKVSLTVLTLALFCSCKKKDVSPASVQVQVSGLTTKTSLSITVTDNTKGIVVLSLINKFGNNTYSSSAVSPGDQLTIHITSNVDDNLAGDGDAQIKYFFKGDNFGAHGGQVNVSGFSQNETVPQP